MEHAEREREGMNRDRDSGCKQCGVNIVLQTGGAGVAAHRGNNDCAGPMQCTGKN